VLDAAPAPRRGGDFEALVAVLDPDVVLRADAGALVGGAAVSKLVRGAEAVAGQAVMFRSVAVSSRLVLVNGSVGVVTLLDGKPMGVMGVTVADGRIVAVDILADPERLARLDLSALEAAES